MVARFPFRSRGEKTLEEILTKEQFFNYKFYFKNENKNTMEALATLWFHEDEYSQYLSKRRRIKHSIMLLYEESMEDLE